MSNSTANPQLADGSNPTSAKSKFFGHLGALICVAMWGVSFVSTKVLLNLGMQPVEIYIYRFVLAYILILFLRPTRLFCNNWRDEMLLLLCGLSGGSIYFLLENFALRYTLVSNVSLLTSTSPLITALLVGALYRSERLGPGMLLGSGVAFLGVACVIFNSSFSIEINPLGDLLALSGAFSWALYSLVLKQLNAHYDVWFITRKTFFYGVLTALPFLWVEPPHFSIGEFFHSPQAILNIAFLGLGASLVAYVLWAVTIKKVGAVKANNYIYLQPVITLIVSVVWLGEAISAVGYIGCFLILFGLWLGDYISRRSKKR